MEDDPYKPPKEQSTLPSQQTRRFSLKMLLIGTFAGVCLINLFLGVIRVAVCGWRAEAPPFDELFLLLNAPGLPLAILLFPLLVQIGIFNPPWLSEDTLYREDIHRAIYVVLCTACSLLIVISVLYFVSSNRRKSES